MQVHLLKSKIHRAQVTDANVNYEGSLGIDQDLMDQVGLLPFERILCGNLNNAARFETYAIPAPRASGAIVLNGAVARLGQPGDRLTIMSYAVLDEATARTWLPRIVVLGERNSVLDTRGP
jgi:aspartate 1-decarboxylase